MGDHIDGFGFCRRTELEYYNLKDKNAIKTWLSANSFELSIPTMITIPGMEYLRCFKNVEKYVKKYPETWEACYGWSVIPTFHYCNQFNLECHVVLRNRVSKKLVDITPDIDTFLNKKNPKLFVADQNVYYIVSLGIGGYTVGRCEFCQKNRTHQEWVKEFKRYKETCKIAKTM